MKRGLILMMVLATVMATAQTQVEIKLNQVGCYPLEQKTVVVEGADPTGKITVEDSEGIHAQVKVANYGLFTTDYWNYRMFKTISENNKRHVSPGTLGILTDPAHPLFASFPTDAHTNWQWFPVIKASNPFKLDNISPYNAEEYN